MKKRLMRACSLVMVIAIMLAVAVTPAAGASPKKKTVKVYSAFGDSIPAGFAEPSYEYVFEDRNNVTNKVVKESYLRWVGELTDAETVNNLTKIGTRASDFCHVLDPSYPTDGLSTRYLPRKEVNGKTVVDEKICAELRKGYIECIKESDLITVEYGNNDLFQPIMAYKDAVEGNVNIVKTVASWGVDAKTQEMLQMAQWFGSNTVRAQECKMELLKSVKKFQESFDFFVKFIHKTNPKAKLVIVGFYNPLSQISVQLPTGEQNVGKALDFLANIGNDYISNRCKYRKYYIFADIKDIECFMGIPGKPGYKLDPHPTPAGHKKMARQIVKAAGLS